MNDRSVQIALIVLESVGALSVICIADLIAVLKSPDVAALAVLASIASAVVGGVAGMVTTSQQSQAPRSPDSQLRISVHESSRSSDSGK
jgi:hypothetical protein